MYFGWSFLFFLVSCAKEESLQDQEVFLLNDVCFDIPGEPILKHGATGTIILGCGNNYPSGPSPVTPTTAALHGVSKTWSDVDKIRITSISTGGRDFVFGTSTPFHPLNVNDELVAINSSDWSHDGITGANLVLFEDAGDTDGTISIGFDVKFKNEDWSTGHSFTSSSITNNNCKEVHWYINNYSPCSGYMIIEINGDTYVDTRNEEELSGTIYVNAGDELVAYLYGVNCNGVAIAGTINISDNDSEVDGDIIVNGDHYTIAGNIFVQ